MNDGIIEKLAFEIYCNMTWSVTPWQWVNEKSKKDGFLSCSDLIINFITGASDE